MAELTRAMLEGLSKNGFTDPIEYYKRPFIGHLFRERINIGLRMLDRPKYGKVLEVGYSAGAVLLALAPNTDDLYGLDLDAAPEPVSELLATRNFSAKLVQGNVYELPYSDELFDLVVSFSVFEHLHEFQKGLSEVARTLRPLGQFLLGMPAVNGMMEVGFRAIGLKGINDHHVTTPKQVASRFEDFGFHVLRHQTLDFPFKGIPVYYTWLLEKRT